VGNRRINEMFDLHGKVAIVTGGGTHLGIAFTESLAELGAHVYIASRRAQLCKDVAWQLRGRGLQVTGLGCDAMNETEVSSLVHQVIEESGRLDVLVANAGGSRVTKHPPHGDLAEFRRALEMNMVSTYISAQEAAKVMLPQGTGAIITLGSIAARLAMDTRIYNPGFQRSGAPYIAAKAGILGLTRALAAEFSPHGIRVNCISPGQIPNDQTDKDQVEIFRLMNALQRTGLAEDVKGAVALLATDAGAWITGQELIVDGGWSMW
jgi:NAD(P)-dependent dehydrogenase (short-subunit alcohol dehydrogenase family)